MRHQRQGLPRVLRKARAAAKTELDRAFDSRLAAIRRVEQEEKEKASAAYYSAVGDAGRARAEAYKKAEKATGEARAKLLEELAAASAQEEEVTA